VFNWFWVWLLIFANCTSPQTASAGGDARLGWRSGGYSDRVSIPFELLGPLNDRATTIITVCRRHAPNGASRSRTEGVGSLSQDRPGRRDPIQTRAFHVGLYSVKTAGEKGNFQRFNALFERFAIAGVLVDKTPSTFRSIQSTGKIAGQAGIAGELGPRYWASTGTAACCGRHKQNQAIRERRQRSGRRSERAEIVDLPEFLV